MNILLVNPPNCGRSIPEERYGIDSLKQIFRGEPLALEVIASGLTEHELTLLDLKAEDCDFKETVCRLKPQLIAFTAMTCEANTVKQLAAQAKKCCQVLTVVGGIHASNDPEFFNCEVVDYIVIGLGQQSMVELMDHLEHQPTSACQIDGVAPTSPGQPLNWQPRRFSTQQQLNQPAPRYDLTTNYRSSYFLSKLQVQMGFVVTAYGCPYRCSFCSIAGQSGGQYLCQPIDSVIRDLKLLPESPFVRLVDANTFGSISHARKLCQRIADEQINKQYLIDVRADTVVRHPDLLKQWQEIGLRSVVIGFEEISDKRLTQMNKQGSSALNSKALEVLNQLGITVVGDFIVDPDYDEEDFAALEHYISRHHIDLPMLTIMTPLPGTAMYEQQKKNITEHNLDYYTLTNAVTATRLPEKEFYSRYAELLRSCHAQAKI
ncbi:MAG: cobalamin-dependent protein [Desulfuromonas sp.]|nr:cobalamin-dependent protein [Desulfuromonas sp.]